MFVLVRVRRDFHCWVELLGVDGGYEIVSTIVMSDGNIYIMIEESPL